MTNKGKVASRWKRECPYFKKLTLEDQQWYRAWEQTYYGLGRSDSSIESKEGYRDNNATKRDLMNAGTITSLEYLDNVSTIDPETICIVMEKIQRKMRA